MEYILVIDQSTQGTKGILLNNQGIIVCRQDKPHEQIINEKGWVSHDLDEIYKNVLSVVKLIVEEKGIEASDIKAVGICNQRETTAIWHENGESLNQAVVWQCNRATNIAEGLTCYKEEIYKTTGLPLSPYFSAAKMRWLLDHANIEDYKIGTIDTWLIYKLTKGEIYATDYSNASRTQLLNIKNRKWDEKICGFFGIPVEKLPEIKDSNGDFGETDFEGILNKKIPIRAVMGDSHGALYAQGCHECGMAKATYGTGSSVMLNVGSSPIESRNGLASSVGWSIDGRISFVLEGNINYTGAVVSWLKNRLEIISDTKEIESLIQSSNKRDETVLIPAFTGLSAPYWRNDVKAIFYGMSPTTGKAEIVKSGIESIGFQVMDVVKAMEAEINEKIKVLRVDGGATSNEYLMQFQSDMIEEQVQVSEVEELSALGVGILAGETIGLYEKEEIFGEISYNKYKPLMNSEDRKKKADLWKNAVATLTKEV